MGRAIPQVVETRPSSVGTFEQGLEIGRRNGGLISERLKARTVGTQGCEALPQLQSALLAVTRTLKGPQNQDDALVSGFFTGYLRAVREALRETRQGCDALTFDEGTYAGSLLGTLFCQAKQADEKALSSLTSEPFYEGWAGGNESLRAECQIALEETALSCDLDLSQTLETACNDGFPLIRLEE